MPSLPPPPRRCSPEAFFLQYLPDLWRAFSHGRHWEWPAGVAQMEVIVGDGPAFTLTGSGGDVQAVKDSATNPIVRLRCNHEAWRVFVGDIVSRILQHTEAHLPKAHAGVQMISQQVSQDRLATVQQRAGVVTLAYIDDAGDTSHYAIAVGDGIGPTATVTVRDADVEMVLDALAGDSIADNIARLLRTRVQLSGDAAYVVRLLQ